MLMHYLCFVFFLCATVAFFVADVVDPPPEELEVHLATEIIKIVSSVFL